ncbi:32290_t:CDS:2 [Gigaspora margarita]|uniref:32290_t:CDS:1 n=1 Tax=Gigaspora margarita TaxID=4874 RepID=A0ABN7UK89_GIGMA|nr:32290_t:CDS:2 [Gigaspora margarita]
MDLSGHLRTPSQTSFSSLSNSPKLHFLIPILPILTIFGPGFQSISTFTFLWFILSIFYIRNTSKWWLLLIYYILNSVGFMFAYLNMLGSVGLKGYPGIIFSIGLLVNLIMFVSLILDKISQHMFNVVGWARILTFPFVWTGLWTIFLYTWAMGDMTNYAFSLLGVDEIMQFASFAGLSGINFILTWGGPVGCDVLTNWLLINTKNSLNVQNGGSLIIDQDLEDHSTDTILSINNIRRRRHFFKFSIPSIFTSLFVYLIVLFIVISYGSIRLSTGYLPFYQQTINDFVPSSLITMGCVIRQNSSINSDYIETTRELAANGSKLVLWSEGSGNITDTTQLNDLFTSLTNISQTYNTYVGVAYIDLRPEQPHYNKLAVISPSGDIIIDYTKSHLVPFLESKVFNRGVNVLQTNITKELGVIGAAICFDYDFPSLIKQASSKNVNLMLDASPVGILHARMNAVRSIENGFTMLRCNANGISGVWGPYGQPYHYVPTTITNTKYVIFQVPLYPRVKTVYGIFGETFGWICVAMSGVIIIAMIIEWKGSAEWKATILKWF